MPKPELKDLVMLKISDWNDVGLQLNLDEHDLYMIRKSHSDFNTRRREMFALWLCSDPSPSYRTLARALFRADENRIATEICTRHGKVSLMHMEIFQNRSLRSDYCESDPYFAIYHYFHMCSTIPKDPHTRGNIVAENSCQQ